MAGSREGRRTASDMEEIRAAIHAVCEEDNPVTVRQIFYRLVSAGAIDKTEADYKRTVVRLCGEMRLAGDLPWHWIVDNTRWVRRPRTYRNVEDALQATAETYRRALWTDAPVVVEVWLEKEALSGVVVEETYPIDVPLYTCRGYPSLSYLHDAAVQIAARDAATHIIYLGDHDPSGVDIPRSIEERLREFAPEAELTFERLAVTPAQIVSMKLQTRPTKQTDTRIKAFGTGESVELDAIPPRELRRLVKDAIMPFVDIQQLKVIETAEADERRLLRSFRVRKPQPGTELTYASFAEAIVDNRPAEGDVFRVYGEADGWYAAFDYGTDEHGLVDVRSVDYGPLEGVARHLNALGYPDTLGGFEPLLAAQGVPVDRMKWRFEADVTEDYEYEDPDDEDGEEPEGDPAL